jgi:hypothetical protein
MAATRSPWVSSFSFCEVRRWYMASSSPVMLVERSYTNTYCLGWRSASGRGSGSLPHAAGRPTASATHAMRICVHHARDSSL